MYYVYLYYIGDLLVYIGKATGNPYTRYWNHVKKEHTWQSGYFSAVNRIGIIPFLNQAEMEICEIFLIVTKKPLWNTRDVYPTLTPTLQVWNIPKEKIYSIEEFLVRYGNKNAKNMPIFEEIFTELDVKYYKEQQLCQSRTLRPEGKIYLYYAGTELMYISSSVGQFNHKRFVTHFEALARNGANFSIVDRIDMYTFPTNAEANIYEKYCIATKCPQWLCDNPLWNCRMDIQISNPLVLESLPEEHVKRLCREMDNTLEIICGKCKE